MDIGDSFSKFQLEILPSDWIETVWKEEFPSPLELPSEYELQVDCNFVDVMREVRIAIKRWLEEDQSDSESNYSFNTEKSFANMKSWNVLNNKVHSKGLICILSSFITQFSQEDCDEESKQRSIEASKLYFTLLSVEGAYIFQIYNSVVFSQAIEIFNSGNSLNSKQSSTVSKGRGKKQKDNDQDELPGNEVTLSAEEKKRLISYLCSMLDELKYCLCKFSLKNDPDSISLIINALMLITGLERTTSSFLDQKVPKNSITYMAYTAYEIIEQLCSPYHGDVDESLRDLMRAIRTSLSIYDRYSWHNVSKDALIIKDHTIKFLLKIIKSLGEVSYPKVTALVQQICLGIPDKADIRNKYVQMVADMLLQFPQKLYHNTLLWIVSLCFSDSVKNRLSGIEIVARLLELYDRRSSLKHSISSSSSNEDTFINSKFLFAVILSRCHDISPRIRAKSLAILAPLILSRHIDILEIIEEIFLVPLYTNQRKEMFDFFLFFRTKSFLDSNPTDLLPSNVVILELLEGFACDSKVFVRKNALHVLANICLLNCQYMTKERLQLFTNACKDVSVGIRKMLVQCLTDLLLKYPDNELVAKSWVEGVVLLFSENEVKAQEKVLEIAESVILDNLVPYNKISDPLQVVPWITISLIIKQDMRKLFKFSCKHWCTNKKIKDQFTRMLQTYIGTEYNCSALFFILCISEAQDLSNPEPMLDYFYDEVFQKPLVDEFSSQLVMQVLFLNWRGLPPDRFDELCAKLKESVINFQTPFPLIASSIDIITVHNSQAASQWAKSFIAVCEQKIKIRMEKVRGQDGFGKDDLLCRAIFTLGELTLICPDVVSKDIIKLLSDVVDIAPIDPNLLMSELPKMGRVHAVIVCVLGKLSLQNHITGKVLVPVLGSLVGVNSPSEVKIAANIALTDLCIRFSSLVEPYFGDMCVCLKDPNPAVRRNILTLLTMLVQEDFLKLKAPVFLYILSMMRDSSAEIKDFASSFIINSLLKKFPSIMCQHFIRGILFLNNFLADSANIADQVSPQEKAAFCLVGEQNTESRRELYRFMLNNMQDDMRFKTLYRICNEILDPVCEGVIPLEGEGVNILKDALYVLGCDEIKLNLKRGSKDGQEEEDEEAETLAIARSSIMSQLFATIIKRNLTENVVPIIIKLKHKLNSLKSPLLRDLMICLREILKDFKEQVDEILAADADLAAEVAHDLRKMEEEEAERLNVMSPQTDDSQGDNIMAEMRKVAHRISEGVLLHGTDIIANDLIPQDDGPNQSPSRKANCNGSLTESSENMSPVVKLIKLSNNTSTPLRNRSEASSPPSSVSSLSSASSSSRSSRSSNRASSKRSSKKNVS